MKQLFEDILEWGKKRFHFLIATYFWIFAGIRLRKWNPHVVVITGSNGKTSTLHMVETVLKEAAVYSHKANSSYGLAFFLLNMKRQTLRMREWPSLFWHAITNITHKTPAQDLFVAEADCDRPNEGEFLAKRLKPSITIWLNTARTHAVHYDSLMTQNKFPDVQDAIAYEFGHLIENASGHCIINGDDPRIVQQTSRTNAQIHQVSLTEIEAYSLSTTGTLFRIHGTDYHFPNLLPKEFGYSILATLKLSEIMHLPVPASFEAFISPPGRSNLFAGIKNTIILDSSYNANANSMCVVLDMVKNIEAPRKIAVIGELLEQGSFSEISHTELATYLYETGFDEIVLNGQLVKEYTLPALLEKGFPQEHIHITRSNKEAYETVQGLLEENDLIVVKGGRQEGIVEYLLANPEDAAKLCRREEAFALVRRQEGM